MASAPEGMTVIAVTPVNFEEIIEASTGHPCEEPYTEEKLRELMTNARANNSVAFVCFMDDSIWHTTEGRGLAVHDTSR